MPVFELPNSPMLWPSSVESSTICFLTSLCSLSLAATIMWGCERCISVFSSSFSKFFFHAHSQVFFSGWSFHASGSLTHLHPFPILLSSVFISAFFDYFNLKWLSVPLHRGTVCFPSELCACNDETTRFDLFREDETKELSCTNVLVYKKTDQDLYIFF